MEMIEGQITKVPNPYTVVINRGDIHGVEEDMRFIIYRIGDDIIDPETGDSLGELEYVKAKVKITYVAEKYSIAETYKQELKSSLFGNMVGSGLYERKKLAKDPADFYDPNEFIIPVEIGDLTKQILD